jgi:predicted ATPase
MPFLTEVHFQNYRSFLDAKCRLSPVTVVIGANNAGKSNFLRGVAVVAKGTESLNEVAGIEQTNVQCRGGEQEQKPTQLTLKRGEDEADMLCNIHDDEFYPGLDGGWLKRDGLVVRCESYNLSGQSILTSEQRRTDSSIGSTGDGMISVLRMLQEEMPGRFDEIIRELKGYVPEVEGLEVRESSNAKMERLWELYAKESGYRYAVPMRELSPGTRVILGLLTIIYQPSPPELILLEDIERDIHPRGLKPLVETMRKISKEHGVQIIFTTQSPYVLDSFQDPEHWDSVVIVEKRDGVSTLTNAKERLIALGYEREMDKVPLGDLWYSGLLGGVAGPNELWDEKEPKS